ncbi:MAG TPA: PQQ-dependent sugar dehydrogenase [Tepidisphaeraceae bacterium]|jgi:glucose/arabinose dehydrogenase|nr:PQQ-dependent sugar dehydrogenase [Tepidisphaeraceae bacterium]
MRRHLRLLIAVTVSLLSATPSLRAQLTNPITTGTLQTNLFRIANIPTATQTEPIDLVTIPDDPGNRLFVATHKGFIRLIKNNTLQSTAFLDLAARGFPVVGGGSNDERGLLGLAFHPNFYAPDGTPGRGKFYTYTSEAKVGNADFSHPEIGLAGGDHQSVVREWTVNLSNPDVADASIAPRILMRIAEPQSNHNGGALRFGNDGMLYISLGDGGGGDDFSGSITSTTDGHTNPNGNGQDTTNVYGKILRINPTGNNSVNGKYGVPSDNPFFGSLTAVNEIFAYGLRNPFRINFDRPTGKLYVGDVGQGQREEVDIVTSGQNYGWAFMEGTRPSTVRPPPPGFTSVAPIGEYTHGDGRSITGGYVYHGSVPEWHGKYIFGDYLGFGSAGRLFYMDQNGGTIFQFNNALSGGSLYAFGEDADGELYALMNTGAVDRLIAPNAWNVDGGGSWGNLANWTPSAALPTDARFLNRLSRGHTAIVTLDGDRTIDSLTISNPNQYVIAQGTAGTLYVDTQAGVHVLRGSHMISAPLALVFVAPMIAPITLEVAADSQLSITGPTTISGSVRKVGSGTVIFSNTVRGGQLGVLEGQLRLAADAGVPATTSTAATAPLDIIVQRNTSNTASGTLILDADQDLRFLSSHFDDAGIESIDLHSPPGSFRSVRLYFFNFSSTYSTLASAIAHAITNPGDGIYDSRISGFSNMRIGIAQMADAHGDQHLFMRPTMIGDLNLDGSVSIADFIELASHFNQTSARWQDGDVNYDNTVSIADFLDLAANFNTSYAGEIFPIDPAEQKLLDEFYAANVPEPASLFALFVGAVILFHRFAGRALGRAA